jgi:hypothetical protein
MKRAAGVDNTARRTWDKEEFAEKAAEREAKADKSAETAQDIKKRKRLERDPLHQGLIVERSTLKHREYQLDLASRLGKSQVSSSRGQAWRSTVAAAAAAAAAAAQAESSPTAAAGAGVLIRARIAQRGQWQQRGSAQARLQEAAVHAAQQPTRQMAVVLLQSQHNTLPCAGAAASSVLAAPAARYVLAVQWVGAALMQLGCYPAEGHWSQSRIARHALSLTLPPPLSSPLPTHCCCPGHRAQHPAESAGGLLLFCVQLRAA